MIETSAASRKQSASSPRDRRKRTSWELDREFRASGLVASTNNRSGDIGIAYAVFGGFEKGVQTPLNTASASAVPCSWR